MRPRARKSGVELEMDIDPDLREQKREEWNKPVLWPLALALLILLAVLLPAWIAYRQRERRTAR